MFFVYARVGTRERTRTQR